jgi:parallel beta-helix repeat protein
MSRFFANTVKVALCLGLAALLALGLTQAEQPAKAADLPDTLTVGQWTESEDNPVYDSEAKAYYPSVLFDGTTYRMWYAGNSGIFYTESADGVNWVSGTAVTGLVLTANHPHVEYCGDKYIMWYQDTTESKLYSIEAIRYAESTDGTTWENDQAITGNIISGVAGQWNGGSYGAIDVFYNPSASGTGTYPFDYSYAMYYDATTGGLESIGLGYSTDGITWELYGEVLPTGNDGTWDSDYATFGTIIKESDNSWHMWYSGGQSKSNEGIGHAYSTDGLTWTRDIANPILHKNDEIEWRNGRTYTPAVIKIGDEYKMWFSCADSSDISKIGYMTSKGTFSTIQSAIDAAVSGTTINVKNGVYNESIVIDVPNLTITGEDTATTIVDAQGSDIAVYIQKNLENFYIHGFTIQNWNIGGIVQPMSQRDNTASHVSNNIVKPRAAGPTLHGNSIQVSGDYSDVIGNEVQVTGYDLTESEDAPTGILVIGADNTAIRDNHVYYIEGGNLKECKGIAVGGSAKNGWEISTGNTIDHNIVEGVTHGIVVWASTVNTEITNNTVRNNEAGFYSQTRYDNEIPYGTQIHHNSIINNGFGILSENEIVDATKNWWGTTIKSEITANISGSVSYDPYYDSETMDNCIRNKNIYNTTRDIGYDTIQDAVDDVGTGDTITVADGTYAGAVVTRPVILRPEDGALVTIDTGPLFATGLRAGFYFPDTSGSGTTIEGFRFAGTQQMKRSAKDDDNKLDIAIYSTDADDITITDCIITDTLQAITNWHGDRWLIDNVRITNLWCLNGGGIGILIGARNGSSVHHNIVRNTTIEGTMSTSDEEKGGYDGQGITLYSDFRSGKSGGTITDTLITGNVIGMTSDNPGLVNFNGLELSDTREADAVSLTITGNIITNNTFHDNSGDGITVSRGAANNSFRENAVNGNNSFGIINTGPDALLARANWWGTADGAGVAAVISGNVQYDPYYDSETMDNLVSHKKVYNTTQDIGYDTIQSAVDEADAGDSINVAAGNYQENLVVNKSISIIGTSAGSNPTVFLKPVSDTPVISIRASGMSAGNPLLLKNLHITTDNSTRQQDGKMTGIMITNPGNTLSNIKLDTITVIGNNHPYDDNNIPPVKTYGGLESGVKINKDTSVNTLEITQCFFKDLSYGFMCGESTSDNPQTLEYCVISNSRFEHNSMKGIYIERLSFSEFSDLIVVDNGITTLSPDWADKYNSGIDINLKFGNYENITFTNLTVTGNGIGSADGTGLTIKARGTGNDSDSYKVKPATLTNVTVNGGTFDGNTIGIRIGERDKNNTSPTNVTLSNIDIKKTNESGGLINCLSGVTLNAVNNWWDSPDGPEHTGNTYNIDNQGVIAVGDIDFAPWFRTAAGTGFSPVTNGENGYPSLQSAIDAASPGDTLQAAPGMFTE